MSEQQDLAITIGPWVRAWLPRLEREAARVIQARLGPWATPGAPPPSAPNLVVEPLAHLPLLPPGVHRIASLNGCWAGTLEEEGPVILFPYRGKVESLLRLQTPLRLLHRPRPDSARRLFLHLSFALKLLLEHQNHLLLHCAILSRGTRTLLIAGQRGVGKTPLTLTLLTRGWNGLTDDKAVVTDGTALPYNPQRLPISDYHLGILPELAQQMPGVRRLAASRALARHWAARILPPRLLPSEDRLWGPTAQIPMAQLTGREPLGEATPTEGVVVTLGSGSTLTPLAPEVALPLVERLQALAFTPFTQWEQLLAVNLPEWSPPSQGELLGRHLPITRWHRLTLPPEPHWPAVAELLERC